MHENGGGKREYSGAQLISQYLPTIIPECLICKDNLELLVQPYVHDAQQYMLFNAVECYEQAALPLVRSIIDKTAAIARESLEYTVAPSLNDNLYINRLKTKSNDEISGRIEAFYVGKKINLAGVEVEWEDLISKRFIIDGVEYKETLHELLECACKTLNPANIRLTAICHGDFHEMNVYSKSATASNNDFQFLDCEYSGQNDVIGDAIVTIIYQSVLTAYLGPKYHSAQFANMPGLPCAQSKFVNMSRNISVLNTEKSITLDDIGNFGTSEVRKEMVRYFINFYLEPILHIAQEQFKIPTDELEEKIKACLLLRLIGVYNVSVMEPMDQAKILGLLFKIVATPIKNTAYVAALDRLKSEL